MTFVWSLTSKLVVLVLQLISVLVLVSVWLSVFPSCPSGVPMGLNRSVVLGSGKDPGHLPLP